MFTFMLSWEDFETAERSKEEIYIDDNGDWRSYSRRHQIFYLWEDCVLSYDEITEGPKKAQRIGIFFALERDY